MIRSKIQAPVLRSTTLSRDRLHSRLTDAVKARVTLVLADAGYGKTTLLTDFAARSGLRTLWYRLDATDADTITWTNYLIACCREVAPKFGAGTLSLLRHLPAAEPPRSAFIASFLGELAQLPEAPTLLVLDDFHLVDQSAEVREIVVRVIDQAPPWLSIVIAARRRPSIEFGRIAGMGELVEIGTDELRFSTIETERLFAESYGQPLEADVLHGVERRTRGWAASLQLFHGSIRGRPTSEVRALARLLSGASSPIYDFLAEEVLANLPDGLNEFLIRISILDRVIAGHVVALFADGPGAPTLDTARNWIEEADGLGLLSRSSQTSEARQLHPLLRDFLLGQLNQRLGAVQVRDMHVRVANAVAESDPLTACHHFIEAGLETEAMGCLGRSVMLTVGSGQWGVASELIDRLSGVPADPAVAAIRARRLIEDGDLVGAERLLLALDISQSAPHVRAVVRQTKLTLGWRTGDNDLLTTTLREMQDDAETPAILRDIAQIFIDASPLAGAPVSYVELARRMERMAREQAQAGLAYYAAVSLHNAAVSRYAAGGFSEATRLCNEALIAYDSLSFVPSERYSTYALLAACWLELGNPARAEENVNLALSSGLERADVHADLAYLCAVTGDVERAERLLQSAHALRKLGRSDTHAVAVESIVRALLDVSATGNGAPELAAPIPAERSLDVGTSLSEQVVTALVQLALGQGDRARETASDGLSKAQAYLALPADVRFSIILALSTEDKQRLTAAIGRAQTLGSLALLETAHAVGQRLDLAAQSSALGDSIAAWPRKWLPILRRQLHGGDLANARAAAELLDRYGSAEDVVRLRAFAKTYGARSRALAALGRALTRRVSSRLEIHDLGRVVLQVGDRVVPLSAMRRKPASLLMYLATRPNCTATREQVLDELWPENEPQTATNSLNQTLYFLRRDIDPWYEDDMSAEYVLYQGEIVWLDPDLVSVSSAVFLADMRATPLNSASREDLVSVVEKYAGPFAPEFEYEEWAISWRSRVHAAYLEFGHRAIDRFVAENELGLARELATKIMDIDPTAAEIERRLIWIYWQLGARSAASALYERYRKEELGYGLEPSSLAELTQSPPTGNKPP